MNVVHSFVIWRGVWYSPLQLVSSSSRSWENVMQVVPSEGDIRFSPVQTDIFRWVQKTGSSQLICALCTPAEFLCCQQTHKIEKTSSLFCKVHRLCKINWRRVTPPTNYFIMGKHWLQYIYCYNNYYYIILYYIILHYIILYCFYLKCFQLWIPKKAWLPQLHNLQWPSVWPVTKNTWGCRYTAGSL